MERTPSNKYDDGANVNSVLYVGLSMTSFIPSRTGVAIGSIGHTGTVAALIDVQLYEKWAAMLRQC
jgi:hypothetical protein